MGDGMIFFVCCILSYLLGSVSISYLLGKLMADIDIREHGSGNAGTTNAVRVLGKKIGLLTFLFDFMKGLLPVILSTLLLDNSMAVLVGICAVLGHNFPIFLKFKGGKGVATSFGVLMAVAPWLALGAILIFIILVLLIKYVSVGSMVASSFVGFYCIFMYFSVKDIRFLFILFLVLLLMIRHKSNIQRLIRGEENKISFKKE